MADKPAQKQVSISIHRQRPFPIRFIVATGFKLRLDKSTSLIDILIEVGQQKGERIIFDPLLMRSNLESLKQFAASTRTEPDDAAQREDVSVGEQSTYANIIHLSRMEHRSETIFSVFSQHDWVEATRQTAGAAEINSIDYLSVISSAAFQKKLLLEIILLVSNVPRP